MTLVCAPCAYELWVETGKLTNAYGDMSPTLPQAVTIYEDNAVCAKHLLRHIRRNLAARTPGDADAT